MGQPTPWEDLPPKLSVFLQSLPTHATCLVGPSPPIPGFPAMFKVLKLTPASLSLISVFLPTLPKPCSSSSLLRKQLSFFYLCSSPQAHFVQLVFIVQISTTLCSNHFTRTGFILLSFKIFSYLGLSVTPFHPLIVPMGTDTPTFETQILDPL